MDLLGIDLVAALGVRSKEKYSAHVVFRLLRSKAGNWD